MNDNDAELARLTAEFERLGADQPEAWAHSQVMEDLPQLARFVFLRGAWDCIVDAHDDSWIDRRALRRPADTSMPDVAPNAFGRLLDAGVDRGDLHAVVRDMQQELLFSLCYMLEDPGSIAGNNGVSWAFFELDENENPVRPITSLHESVIETDPANRGLLP